MTLLAVIVYVAALFLCGALGQNATDPGVRNAFKGMWASMHSLFIVMTTTGWVDLVQSIYETEGWGYAVFFDFFIVLTNMTVMNVR